VFWQFVCALLCERTYNCYNTRLEEYHSHTHKGDYEESLMGSIGTFSVELCGCGCGRKAKVSQENQNSGQKKVYTSYIKETYLSIFIFYPHVNSQEIDSRNN